MYNVTHLFWFASLLVQIKLLFAASEPTAWATNFLQQGVQLVQQRSNSAADPTLPCDSQHVLHMLIDGLALPPGDFTVAVTISPPEQQRTQQTSGVLFTAAGLSVSMNRRQGTSVLSFSSGLSAPYQATYPAGPANTTISLAVTATRFRLCYDFSCPAAERVVGFSPSTGGWLSLPSPAAVELKLQNITLGERSGAAANPWIESVWVAPVAIDMVAAAGDASTPTDFFTFSVAVTAPPIITLDANSRLANLIVGKPVTIAVTATSSSSKLGLKLRLTFYGVAPSACAQSSCGDVVSESYSTTSAVQVDMNVTYPRAGRYIVRAQASDMIGGWAYRDFELFVRKIGDTDARAPCCRTTANIIAQQLGRPIDPFNFRPSWINSTATAVGWDSQYLAGPEDMEAERLFDFGILAPVNAGPVTMLTCPDTFLAGPGSPEIYGVSVTGMINADSNQGHAKRVAIVPQGFNWAADDKIASNELPSCVTHWSPWVANTPYGRRDPGSGKATCSYTCTSEGVQQLVTQTGTFDRWSEGMIENSYGILSFLADPVVLPVLYMPMKASAGDTAFSYSEAPLQRYMQGLGYDMFRDFHTVLVLSPRPNFINSGITAWANADGSPLIFVMRCNPQHYYLVHEEGHRLGMPHATLFKLDAGPDAQAPTSPLGAGVMQDTYSDRLDIMACCKGDYSLYNRIMSGWVPASERVTLGLLDIAAPQSGPRNSTETIRRYTLWPYDRPESKGKLKGVSLRLEDGKILVLGYRSMPFWQDVRVGRNSSRPYANDRLLQPEHMRDNVAGLSVEYSKRYFVAGVPQWSVRGLLDFNLAFMRYPDALPRNLGGYPPNPPGASFTLLREGDAWLDEEHNLLVAVERLAACPEQPLVPVYRYGVYGFYGFRGEDPGTETAEQADYTGYASGIKCMQLRIVTGVTTAPGTLDVKIRMQGMDDRNRLVLGGDQCGFPIRPKLQLVLPDGIDILAIVWRDNLNRTVALDVTEMELPALAPLAQSSALHAEQCNSGCDWRYHVKVLAADGAQTQIDITVGSVSLSMRTMSVTYSYYLRRNILTAVEAHNIPVVQQPPAGATAPQGRQLLDQPMSLDSVAQQVFHGASLLDISCSRQWSVSLNMIVPSSQLELPISGASRQTRLLTITSDADTSLSWPAVNLKVSSAGTALLIQWGKGYRELATTFKANSSNQLVIVRDGVRLGAWVNSDGGWLVDNVWCMPDSRAVNYCSSVPPTNRAEVAFSTVRFGDDGSKTGITVNSIRIYNYALPRLNHAKESTCFYEGRCGRFMVAGWQLPASSSVPAGTINLQGAIPSVASTRINLHSNTHFMLVGPWTPCSVRCGGGWQTRDVRCMQLSADPDAPVSQVPLEDCPLGDEMPASSQRCNTVACPWHSMQLLTSTHSSCGKTCELLGSSVDAAQLVCMNSLGQPQPLSRCCLLCNATDWAEIPWNISMSSPWSKLAAAVGSTVRLLQPPAITATSSLADVLSSGLLPGVCDSQKKCNSDVKWQFSEWSSCSKNCGGGVQHRTATCISFQTGLVVSNALCHQAIGAVQPELLKAPCKTLPCKLHTWKLSDWSVCSGTADYGHSSRTATCVDSKGVVAAAGASACPEEPPTSTAVCLRTAPSAVCRPSFVPEHSYGDQDCYGHGTCTMLGCLCKAGWHGQFCEVSAECPGVMTKSATCCASTMLDHQGSCCPPGSILDSKGQCCTAGEVDACGVCQGGSWSVDIRGTCCAGVMDASGSCCASGLLDECGICDGDGTSCRLTIRLLALLPKDTNISHTYTASSGKNEAEPAWHTAIQQLLQLTLSRQAPGWQLQLQQVRASWTSGSNAVKLQSPLQGVSNRHLLSMDIAQDLLETSYALDPAERYECAQDTPELATPGKYCDTLDASDLAADSTRKQQQSSESKTVDVDTEIVSRKLLAAVDWREAYLSIDLQPRVVTPPQGSSAAVQDVHLGLSMSAIGSALVASLQDKATATALASDMAAAEGSNGVQVLRVVMAERVGACGNGICEVGERALLSADKSVLYEATSLCSEDCPLSLMLCAAPVTDTVGDPAKECGGHGKCIRSQGVCDCFNGYTGDACEQCLAGFYPHAGQCLVQYIDGRNIFDVVVDEEAQQKHIAGTMFLVIGGIAAACILAALAWVMYKWLVLGETPKLALAVRKLLWTAKADSMQKKYLLGDELELSSGPMSSAEDFKSKGALRHRASAAAAGGDGGGSDGWDGDLLKAIRANIEDAPHSGQLPVSTPSKSRLSRVSGRLSGLAVEGLGGLIRRVTTSAGGSHRGYSSLGGAEEPVDAGEIQPGPIPDNQPPRNSMTFSDVYGSLQQGISQAGSGVVRVVSEGISRLSTRGSGYERMVTDDEGLLMVHNNWTMAGEGQGAKSVGGSNIGMSPAAAALDNMEDVLQAQSAATADESRSQRSSELSTGVAASGLGSTTPQLARIRTRRTSRQSVSGMGGKPTRMSMVSSSSSTSGSAASGNQQPSNAGINIGSGLRLPSAVLTPPPLSAQAADATVVPRWRTRAEYQAGLAAVSPPVLDPQVLQQVKSWRSPSEAGAGPRQLTASASGGFVSTPDTATDPSSRAALEAFGARMERWFSPGSQAGGDDGSLSGAHAGPGTSRFYIPTSAHGSLSGGSGSGGSPAPGVATSWRTRLREASLASASNAGTTSSSGTVQVIPGPPGTASPNVSQPPQLE